MPKKPHQTQYYRFIKEMMSRAGVEAPGAQVNIQELARFMNVKITPSFRKRIKQCVDEGLLWEVPPSKKINPKMNEYIITYQTPVELPF